MSRKNIIEVQNIADKGVKEKLEPSFERLLVDGNVSIWNLGDLVISTKNLQAKGRRNEVTKSRTFVG